MFTSHTPFRLAFIALFLAACSGDGGGGTGIGFQLTSISLPENAIWKVNKEIVFTFTDAVDSASVSSNTISIQTSTGEPATGTFTIQDNQVTFQPNCPTQENFIDTGLRPGQPYLLRVLGQSSGAANTVRSSAGTPLEVTQVRNFTTADTEQAFDDTQTGPPEPLQRSALSSESPGAYLEIGGNAEDRVYFLLDDAIAPVRNRSLADGGDQDGDGVLDDILDEDGVLTPDSDGNGVPDGDGKDDDDEPELADQSFRVPLNLYSLARARVAFVIEFNQALNPSVENVNADRLHLEFQEGVSWMPLETRVTLESNCIDARARVRLEPVGVLPQGRKVRAVIMDGLEDLVGDPTRQVSDNFAVGRTAQVAFQVLNPADIMGDEVAESFDFNGDAPLSLEDTNSLFETPSASWEKGRLTAAFDFKGDGGPGGAFDWVVEEGSSLVVDTSGSFVLGADGITIQEVVGFGERAGLIDVRDLVIQDGGELRVQGANPLRINATGSVKIDGLLNVSGFDARNVEQLNTGNVAEVGGARGPGGGQGGTANEVVTNSTARGGNGFGPRGESNTGGGGGETGFADVNAGKDARRPGGGGGGRFADQQGAGLTATAGGDGSSLAMGALSGMAPPAGGTVSQGPFLDDQPTNDFFGEKVLGTPGMPTLLIRGELAGLLGGYGGGGGGNADPATRFPTPNWTPASDEKGGGGGGGGGAVLIRALGPIEFGMNGRISCNGGRGGLGENVTTQDHIGGNGGSGSGGHVVLETASTITFAGNSTAISAVGGGSVPTGGGVSSGGAGGPGVIQLHVPNSLSFGAVGTRSIPPANVLVPTFGSRSQARSKWISIGAADHKASLVPAPVKFSFQGTATSGVDDGKVLDLDGDERVDDIEPLLAENLTGNGNVLVSADEMAITGSSLLPFGMETNGVRNDIYLRNTALLKDFVVRLSSGKVSQDFVVSSAIYEEEPARLILTVSASDGSLQDFILENTTDAIDYSLIPRFFRVQARRPVSFENATWTEGNRRLTKIDAFRNYSFQQGDSIEVLGGTGAVAGVYRVISRLSADTISLANSIGVGANGQTDIAFTLTGAIQDSLPGTTFVRVLFQATSADLEGMPASSPVVDWTTDITAFNEFSDMNPGVLQFFRFQVEFDLGGAVSADTKPLSLEFLRIPFVF